jgi:hypothetical protein
MIEPINTQYCHAPIDFNENKWINAAFPNNKSFIDIIRKNSEMILIAMLIIYNLSLNICIL